MRDSRGAQQVSFSLAMAIERLKRGDDGGEMDKSTKMLDYARSYRFESYGVQLHTSSYLIYIQGIYMYICLVLRIVYLYICIYIKIEVI